MMVCAVLAEEVQASISQARVLQDDGAMRSVLREIAKHNYKLVQNGFAIDLCRTVLVSSQDAQKRVKGHGKDPQFTISQMLTGDALLHFAAELKPRGHKVCALNFANGSRPGGGYLTGARAQEEELCRQFPTLYTSLNQAKNHDRAYPFGPCTYHGATDLQHRYADVLFTPRVVARRASQVDGYRLLQDTEAFDNMAIVSAAAPDINHDQPFVQGLVEEAIRTIVVAPKLKDPAIETLVLGAWGCGAFGGHPHTMAMLFTKVLQESGLGRLYQEVHFAIPGGGANAKAFEETLRSCGIDLVRLPM